MMLYYSLMVATIIVATTHSCTHHQARGHTPQGEYHLQTPHHPPQGESRADLTPEEEGRCTSSHENSTA